jgi:hypothetical protein
VPPTSRLAAAFRTWHAPRYIASVFHTLGCTNEQSIRALVAGTVASTAPANGTRSCHGRKPKSTGSAISETGRLFVVVLRSATERFTRPATMGSGFEFLGKTDGNNRAAGRGAASYVVLLGSEQDSAGQVLLIWMLRPRRVGCCAAKNPGPGPTTGHERHAAPPECHRQIAPSSRTTRPHLVTKSTGTHTEVEATDDKVFSNETFA